MRYGLNELTIQKITDVFTKFPSIEKVVLYGSRAKGNYKNGSDIDLCLFGQNIDLALLTKIDLALDDLLTPYSFDLSIYSHLSNQALISHIDRIGIVFFEKNQSL